DLAAGDHKAEGVGFEPTRTVTSSNGFQDLSVSSPDLRKRHRHRGSGHVFGTATRWIGTR
ncbi:MAG TPA: hypothetical protein VHJ18_02485, partial [Streptosporangiaceae bacterium]|nr:hypothetical protein [Streptosporangiaceae bacterium]